jgi:predicted lipoprotein with Yx(FWY)xxD motif
MSRRSSIGLATGLAVAGLAVVIVVLLLVSGGNRQARGRRAGTGTSDTIKNVAIPLDQRSTVGVARSKLGRILVNARGMTLYLFTKDKHGRSTCTGRCTRVWPPVIVDGEPTAASGIAKRKLSTRRRPDGRRQLLYNGHPLYTLTADTAPGQINGQGFEGTWFVISPGGRGVGQTKAAPAGY